MADSDNEDEKFVKNVIHELSAFQTTDKPVEAGHVNTEPSSPDTQANGSTDHDVSAGSTVASSTTPDSSSRAGVTESAPAESAKQPSRIIRLSRPMNPYGRTRAEANTSNASSATTSTSGSTSTSAATTSVTSAAGSSGATPAPGSRLAALQRPGSPMHRILQRAQSPALAAAAARMNRQSLDDPNTGGSTTSASSSNNESNTNSDKDQSDATTAQSGSGNVVSNLSKIGSDAAARISRMRARAPTTTTNATNSDSQSTSSEGDSVKLEDTKTSTEQTVPTTTEAGTPARSIVPPRISSSGLTSSILLRRPASPLSTNRQPLLTRANLGQSVDSSASPKSPPAEGQFSPRQAAGSQDENQSAASERIAIRNKLRANSFRLKDLLTKRPTFGKSKEESENTDDKSGDNLTQNASEDKTSDSTEGDGSKSPGASRLTKTTDRTRWRREGVSTLTRSKSSVAGTRTASLISARYRRTADQATENTSDKQQEDRGTDSAPRLNESIDDQNKNDNHTNHLENSSGNKISFEKQDSKDSEGRSNSVSSDGDSVQSGSLERRRVGATLLRSPRTRANVSEGDHVQSSVPKSQVEVRQGDPHTTAESTPMQNDFSIEPMQSSIVQVSSIQEIEERKAKALSDLEKETEANLVFDSNIIGAPKEEPSETPTEPRVTASPNTRARMYGRSHSEYQRSNTDNDTDTDKTKQKMNSEPATPLSEAQTMRGSKSYDTSADGDFSQSSSALKRCLAVTDLDQAMKDRDQQKLSSIFKGDAEVKTEGGHCNTEGPSSPATPATPSSTSEQETDLDARLGLSARLSRAPRLPPRDPQSPPHSAPPIQHVAPMVYKPNVNLEDAVRWPVDPPGKLDFKQMEVFEGQMLLNWLGSSIDKSHYLRLVMTKHDINVVACQVCTCLVAAGVMKQLEAKDHESIFKTDCMYYWTHTQASSTPTVSHDVSKMTPVWPPPQEHTEENRPGLKYTEADHQAAMVTLRHEYKEEVETLQRDHQGVLDHAREEYETRLQHAMERIALLQQEVRKYQQLAGIEKYSQNALSEANAAQREAGLMMEGVQTNGFTTPGSQYHTPMVTPDGKIADFPLGREGVDPSSDQSLQDGTSGSECGSIGEGVASSVPTPPPAPPPPPGMGGMPPPPPPPPDAVAKKASKPPIKTLSPMRQLYWNRLQVHEIKSPKNKEYADRHLVWEEIEEQSVDITELDKLFSKSNMEPSRRFFNRPKSKAKQAAKVISPKRSQTVGILLSSLRYEMSEIEHAILTFDTSLIGEEKLRQIYENRGDADELKKIRDHLKKHPDTPLDKPDQFLYDLSQIPDYAERIYCFTFRESFHESVAVIETKMTNLRMTCQMLMTSMHVRRVLGMVLALGNYMNGGSKSRGQADGFGLDILPKLKDVKSKDNASSLLHYTVCQYIKKFEGPDAGTDKARYPLPDPSDLNQAALVFFDELEKELRKIKTDFDGAEERAAKVINSAKEHVYLQPFKDFMTDFFEKGRQQFDEQEENLADGKRLFQETAIFFCAKPKSGDKEVTPEFFFSQWAAFCQDFKDIWKREQQRLIKIRIKENEHRVKQMQQRLAKQPVRRREKRAGGLKDRLAKQGLLES